MVSGGTQRTIRWLLVGKQLVHLAMQLMRAQVCSTALIVLPPGVLRGGGRGREVEREGGREGGREGRREGGRGRVEGREGRIEGGMGRERAACKHEKSINLSPAVELLTNQLQ